MNKFNLNINFTIYLIISSMLFSQNSALEGTVTDSLNGNELIGANVFIVGTSLGAATNDDGSYNINNVKPGTYKVKVSYIGYETKEIELDLS